MSKDLDNLNFLINKANIKELKKNVRKFNIKNSIKKAKSCYPSMNPYKNKFLIPLND